MSVKQNTGTAHMRWMLTDKPYAHNVSVSLRMRGTVTVGISSNGYGMEHELTPDEAREMALILHDLAAMTEALAQRD